MRVRAKRQHFNDYPVDGGLGVALGADRLKKEGAEYDIPDAHEAKLLIDGGDVEEVADKKKG